MKAAVYCRVSTEDQADSRTIENQVEFARRYCELHGLEIFGFYLDEGVSGTVRVEDRPAGSRLLADAGRGCFGAVYVYRLDRLARTALDILKTHRLLADADVWLRSMTENFDTSTPSGKFFMTTLGGIAEIERETIAERMRLGKERALREGRWPGGPPPYGYSLSDRRLVINPEEARVVRMIFSLYTGGGMSTASIAGYLDATGVPSPSMSGKGGGVRASRWHGSRVWSILASPAYRGVLLFRPGGGKAGVEVRCPPVVPGDQWDRALAVRRKNYLDAGRNSRREYLLRGLIRCGLCGRSYCGDGSGRVGRPCYYRCSGSTSGRSSRCASRSVRADLIEDIVWQDVCGYLLKSGQALDLVRDRTPPSPGGLAARAEREAIESALGAREKERRKIIGLFRKGVITEGDLAGELAGISREVEALERRRGLLSERDTGSAEYSGLQDLLRRRLEIAGPREKRDLVRGLVDGIVVDGGDLRGRTVPRVTISYVFGGSPGCALVVETRGKYRLGVPKSPY